MTNRALMLAALADGVSVLSGALFSDDSRHFIKSLSDLGFEVEADEAAHTVRVQGLSGRLPRRDGEIYVGSAGTAARFLTAMLAFAGGRYALDASPQMRRRPMNPLLTALAGLGVQVEYGGEEGHFPFVLKSSGLRGGQLSIDIGLSSQFLSALLMSGVMLPEGLQICLTGERKSLPYVEMTAAMMGQFGVMPVRCADGSYQVGRGVHKGACYQARTYEVEPDVSAACYFYAMAALLGISVQVKGVHFDSLQGDMRFLDVLAQLGCRAEERAEGILVQGPRGGEYPGLTVNMNEFSDQSMTMAVLAAFAKSPTRIEGVSHIRYQETDRLAAIRTELNRLGLRCEENADGLTIWPGQVRPAVIETYEDHRMAMAFSLIGLRAGSIPAGNREKAPTGIVIDNPGCCAKTFENYFDVLDGIIAQCK